MCVHVMISVRSTIFSFFPLSPECDDDDIHGVCDFCATTLLFTVRSFVRGVLILLQLARCFTTVFCVCTVFCAPAVCQSRVLHTVRVEFVLLNRVCQIQ